MRIRWRSPLRGPWLTAVLGLVLLCGLPVVIVTGLLDWIAYGPRFGQAIPRDVVFLHLPVMDWPTRPAWLFRLTEGLHVGGGVVLVPVVLAKLWSVIPKLFTALPRNPLRAAERATLVLLVGGILFEIVTGLLNIQYDYVFGFSFYAAHYTGAWVFIAGFVLHIVLKLPTMVRSLRSRSFRVELHTPLGRTEPEPPAELVAPDPDPPTMSRRGALGVIAGGSLLLAGLTVGQTLDGPLRSTALLLPRGRTLPGDFPINRTFAASRIGDQALGTGWRLTLGSHLLTRDELAGLPQHTAELPIACVEGWSTQQRWTGVRLRDLAVLAGVAAPARAVVRSLEDGPFARATLTAGQVLDADALLALRVNGADLSPDHGYPARVIVPALPGVHCTKWVTAIEFTP